MSSCYKFTLLFYDNIGVYSWNTSKINLYLYCTTTYSNMKFQDILHRYWLIIGLYRNSTHYECQKMQTNTQNKSHCYWSYDNINIIVLNYYDDIIIIIIIIIVFTLTLPHNLHLQHLCKMHAFPRMRASPSMRELGLLLAPELVMQASGTFPRTWACNVHSSDISLHYRGCYACRG